MTMQHLFTDELGDLAALYDDVELVSVSAPSPAASTLSSRAVAWLARGDRFEARWEQSADLPTRAEGALTGLRDSELAAVLRDEIASAVEVLTDLLSCSSVGVRVATLSGPMCPRFHTDLVPCRMLLTLGGRGTEWIAHGDVDFDRFERRQDDSAPTRPGGQVRTLPTGAWSVLKGGRWDARFGGVVHRSPHEGGRRLLLSFDPMFTA
jgi:hypothetical protein